MRAFARLFGAALFLVLGLSAADLTGIWMGETKGRNGEKQDIAFQFLTTKGAVTGIMFGDEFDLPVDELKIDGNQISFSVTANTYAGGRRTKTAYTGVLTETTLELKRGQNAAPAVAAAANAARPQAPESIVLKRLM
jgi:hypothetical protein